MKRAFPFLLIFGFLAVGVAPRVWATSGILLGSMTTVNNTSSNSASVVAGTLTLPGGKVQLQHNGLAATNDIACVLQFSTDNTNFVALSTNWPSGTNAATENFYIPSTSPVVYFRVVITTTNSQQVFVNYAQ